MSDKDDKAEDAEDLDEGLADPGQPPLEAESLRCRDECRRAHPWNLDIAEQRPAQIKENRSHIILHEAGT